MDRLTVASGPLGMQRDEFPGLGAGCLHHRLYFILVGGILPVVYQAGLSHLCLSHYVDLCLDVGVSSAISSILLQIQRGLLL